MVNYFVTLTSTEIALITFRISEIEDNWKDLLKPLPFGRGATAEEIGAAIAFIASDHSGYTSGSVVTIDAGLSARAQAF